MNQSFVEKVIDPLKELVLQDDQNNIPNFTINQNSDLNLIGSNISSLSVNLKNSESESDQVEDVFSCISEYFQDDRNINRLSIIDQTAKSFASLLEQGYTTINSKIIPLVEDLKKKIHLKYQEQLVREKADTLYGQGDIELNESNFSFIDWGSIGQNERFDIIEAACSNANINVKDLSLINLSYILAKLNFSKEFIDIEIPAEVNSKIIDTLVAFFDQQGLTPDQVSFFWRIISDKLDYDNFCINTSIRIKDVTKTASNVLDIINTVKRFDLFSSYVKTKIIDDVNTETLQDISSNVDTVIKTIYAIKYWILTVKEIRFKDKLIITDNIINREVYEDFIREGKSISDVYKYLKAFFHNVNLPTDGVTLSSVISADTNSRLSKIDAKIKSNEVFIKSKCLINAYQIVINQFVNDSENAQLFPALNNPSFKHFFMKAANANATALSGNIDNVDNVLYLTIVNMFYQDSLISTLYKYLGKSFDNLVDSEDDINDVNIIQAQCSAIIELLVDFLFTSNVCIAE